MECRRSILPPSSPDTHDGGTVTIEDKKLGEGAQGCVYRGILVPNAGNASSCAVKIFKYLKDFRRELKNLEYVQTVWGCTKALDYVDNGHMWILFPLEGESLAQLFVTIPSKKPHADFLDDIRTMFDAICALHNAGFVHLDIKPSNVLRRPEGGYCLIDFSTLCSAPCSQKSSPREACYSEYGRRLESPGLWSDVFSAGATALENLVWEVKGPQGLEDFRRERSREQYRTDSTEKTAFFDIKGRASGWRRASVVNNHLDELAGQLPELIAVLRGMLEINLNERFSMNDVVNKWKRSLSSQKLLVNLPLTKQRGS